MPAERMKGARHGAQALGMVSCGWHSATQVHFLSPSLHLGGEGLGPIARRAHSSGSRCLLAQTLLLPSGHPRGHVHTELLRPTVRDGEQSQCLASRLERGFLVI